MPFVSKAQEKWAFATHQPFAKKWADITNQKKLPARKKKIGKHDGRRWAMKRLGLKKKDL